MFGYVIVNVPLNMYIYFWNMQQHINSGVKSVSFASKWIICLTLPRDKILVKTLKDKYSHACSIGTNLLIHFCHFTLSYYTCFEGEAIMHHYNNFHLLIISSYGTLSRWVLWLSLVYYMVFILLLLFRCKAPT